MRIYALVVLLLVVPCGASADTPEDRLLTPELAKARTLLQAGKASEAAAQLGAYRPPRESAALYHYLFAQALAGAKRHDQAIDHYRLAYLFAADRELREKALLLRGDTYGLLGLHYEARCDFAVFLKMFPDSARGDQARLGLARSLYRTGRYREAIAAFEMLPASEEALFGRANALQRLGMTAEAGAAYREAMQKGTTYLQSSEETAYLRGENALAGQNPAEARQYLSLVKSPELKAAAELSLGRMASAAGRLQAAEQHFRAALSGRDRGTRRAALLCLAELQMKDGRKREAQQNLQEIRLHHPYNREYDAAILLTARICREEGKYADAARSLKELVFRRNPSREALDQFELMLREVKGKKDREQLDELWKSVGTWMMDGSREEFLLEMAEAFRGSMQQFYPIINFLSRHGSEEARRNSLVLLAGWHAEMGDFQRARDCLKKAGITRRNDDIQRIEARIFYAGGDYRAASERFLGMQRPGPQDIRLLGRSIARMKDGGAAAARYEKAARGSDDAETLIQLGDYYYDRGKKTDALAMYRLALGREPGNGWALYRGALLSSGDEGREMLRKIGTDLPLLHGVAQADIKAYEVERRIMEQF